MVVTSADIAGWINAYLWPFFRFAALFSVAPVLGTQLVPARVRIALAAAMAGLVAPLIPAPPVIDPFTLAGIVVVAQQVLIGVAIGFVMRLVFAALELAGQVVATQMGLGFGALVDPQTGVQLPLLAHLYTLVATLIFLAIDGHLVLLRILVDSFTTFPPGHGVLGPESFWEVASWGGHMFAGAVLVALPAIAALLVVNLTFGVMVRSAPQLNIFAVGFPITLMLGFVILLVSLPGLLPKLSKLLELGFASVREMVQEL